MAKIFKRNILFLLRADYKYLPKKGERRMFGKFSVKKPYTVLVAVVLVIVLGIVSFTKMTSDLLPNISFPYVLVMTTYPGASPETVEMVVTKPVESSMATVSNIEEISSISSENYSMVILQFAQSADMNAVSLEIRENLDQIKSYWDDGCYRQCIQCFIIGFHLYISSNGRRG